MEFRLKFEAERETTAGCWLNVRLLLTFRVSDFRGMRGGCVCACACGHAGVRDLFLIRRRASVLLDLGCRCRCRC